MEPDKPTKTWNGRTWNGRWVGIILVLAILIVTLPIIVLAVSSRPTHATGVTVVTAKIDLGA